MGDHLYCSGCGHDWPGCGCPLDPNTNALMRCEDGHQWWRAHGETSTVCLHRDCGKPSTVEREPLYAPAVARA